jgi:CheY-like chemotaxis protein
MTTTAEKTMQRILVVDDESSISELISTLLVSMFARQQMARKL